ncbi:hypothetical protein BOTBODRAFT_175131 [Botryobasidium botryosum FD-172 SS1]|uniref:Uncharacterized protein n=1 Tax=Botryobasidium botryosum (strain FD-172 SS1) TaxID=930990 RepID=A0A067MQ43_BOTB1|nr:hypothetical protein BOTBODRAFT_175131 [Botryobasidium botryosum FD-172 SS1]
MFDIEQWRALSPHEELQMGPEELQERVEDGEEDTERLHAKLNEVERSDTLKRRNGGLGVSKACTPPRTTKCFIDEAKSPFFKRRAPVPSSQGRRRGISWGWTPMDSLNGLTVRVSTPELPIQ